MSQDIVDAAKTKLDVLQTYNKISEEGEILYWKSLLGHLKKGSSAYLEAYKSYKEAKQKYNEEFKLTTSSFETGKEINHIITCKFSQIEEVKKLIKKEKIKRYIAIH